MQDLFPQYYSFDKDYTEELKPSDLDVSEASLHCLSLHMSRVTTEQDLGSLDGFSKRGWKAGAVLFLWILFISLE
jgi:hypothetical protein